MKKIIFKSQDQFVEYTKAYRLVAEINVYWPVAFAIILYRSFVPNLVVHQNGGYNYVRVFWFEINYKIGGQDKITASGKLRKWIKRHDNR